MEVIMQFTLHKIVTQLFLLIFTIILCIVTSLANSETINLSNSQTSLSHNYDWVRMVPVPTSEINNPPCTPTLRGMLVVDTNGTLYLCNGIAFQNADELWKQTNEKIFPRDINHRVAIGANTIPNPKDTMVIAETHSSGTNQTTFKTPDKLGNLSMDIITSGFPSGMTHTAAYIDFKVANRHAGWDGRIIYRYNPLAGEFSGLDFVAKHKAGLNNAPMFYPDLRLYADGNVDFGSDATNPPSPTPIIRNPTRKLKVVSYDHSDSTKLGTVKADKLFLKSDGTNVAELKVKYVPHIAGGGGYYATYAP
jgi:hypothetical protein